MNSGPTLMRWMREWWELAEIDAAMGQGVFTPNFESEFAMMRNQLLALL